MSPFLKRPELEWLASTELVFAIRDLHPVGQTQRDDVASGRLTRCS